VDLPGADRSVAFAGVRGRVGEAVQRLAPHRGQLLVVLLILVSSALYAVLGLVKLRTFQASTFDLVIFDQAVRGYAHFGAPVAPSVGVAYGHGAGFLQLADHFSPILVVLAPLYWLRDGPETLIVAQAALFALAIAPIWVYTRRRFGPAPALLVCVAYAASWPIAQAAWFDFHEVAFVPLLTAVAIERFDAGKMLWGSMATLALLLVKEDMGLTVMGFAIFLFVTRRRLDGIALALVGIGAFVLIRNGLIPLAGGDPGQHWEYASLGPDLPSALAAVVRDPLGTLWRLVSPFAKVNVLTLLLWPTLLACLFSPLALAALPQVLERFLADRSQWWDTQFHYNAFVVVILLCAGVDGIVRLRARLAASESDRRRTLARRLTQHWAVAVSVIALTLVPRFALGRLLDPAFYKSDDRVAAARAAVAAVPSGTTVEAVNNVGPALSARTTVLLWDGTSHQAPWIVADVTGWSFPFGSLDDQRRRVDEARQSGYRTVFDRDGYIVLHRP
jgi:uncharacterized membrane protein